MNIKHNNSREYYLDCIIDNLLGFSDKILTEKDFIMLGGTTGVGKTSLVLLLEKLLNINVLVIEASHLSEEHLIDIPFIKKENQAFKIQNSKPFLLSEIDSLNNSPYSKEEYLNIIENDNELSYYFDKYKDLIPTIQQNYQTILFIDEFYRMPNIRISNLLRTILNGYIGTQKIPENIFLIFASNFDFNDEGIHSIPFNHQFSFINIENPKNIEFLTYFTSKHKIEENSFNLIQKLIELDLLGFKDEHINISPRRFEEICLYVNINIQEPKYIYNYLKLSFTNYKTQSISNKWNSVLSLIEDFFNTKFNILNWREIFKNHLYTNEKLFDKRKYSLALTGTHGISKTSFIRQICKEENLNLIEIDTSTLNSDDVIGLPLSKESNGKLETFFSEPPLYNRIMSQYKKVEDNRNYTNILFLDEITRTEENVFNSIRRMLLNKEINESYKLPSDILIVSALNPNGIGTNTLTPHLIDVIDFLPTTLSKVELLEYLKSKIEHKEFENKYNFNVVDLGFDLLDLIFSKLKTSDIENNMSEFYLEIEQENIYISPREIDSIISTFLIKTTKLFNNKVLDFSNKEEINNLYEDIATNFYLSFFKVFHFILIKNRISNKNDIEDFICKLLENKSKDILKQIEFSKTKNILSFYKLIFKLDKKFKELKNPDCKLIINQYLQTIEHDSILIQEITDILNETILLEETYSIETLKDINYLYTFFCSLDYSSFNNNITDRISEVFRITWKTISNNMVYKVENQKLLLDILNKDLLNTTFNEWFKDNLNELTDEPLFIIKESN